MGLLDTILQLEAQLNHNPQVAELALREYAELEELLEGEEDPFLYGFVQTGLGTAYLKLPTGDRAENLTQATFHLQRALRFLDPATQPHEYARALNNLGLAYSDFSHDRAAHLIRAIAYFEEALRIYTRDSMPEDYAYVQMNLGIAYSQLPTGGHPANLMRAITCYQEALQIFTPETHSFEYALAKGNLGTIYHELPTEDRTTNLLRAIDCYKEALRFVTAETYPFEYARTQVNMGSAYEDLPSGDLQANRMRAITCFQEALQFWTPETAPFEYAKTQTNLGNAYLALQTKDRASNVAQAISCYKEALRFLSPEATPFEYAFTHMNLGNAYNQLETEDRTTNLTDAIASLQEALRFWNAETAPLLYAGVQINLGNAYADLPTGDRAANLTQAIACYREALRFWTPDVDPFEYARIQTNLGNAYSSLPTGDRASHLAQAKACYQEALRFWTAEADPFHYAMAQTNLGNAYWASPGGERGTNIAHAITCYQEALRFWSAEAAPFYYAITQANLGTAYQNLQSGDRGNNIARAITFYQEALRFWSAETAPFHYALAQSNLGGAYRDLPGGDSETNAQLAVACYREALRIRTPEAAPVECRTTNRDLAKLYSAQDQWQDALSAYRAALDVGERLYLSGLSTESKMAETSENIGLYRRAAYAAVRAGEVPEALLILERGKTRLLSEALRLQVPRPSSVPEEAWEAFKQAIIDLRTTQQAQTTSIDEMHDTVQSYRMRQEIVRSANARLDTVIEHIRMYAPTFLQRLDLAVISDLLPDPYTAIIDFCISEDGTICFLLSQNEQNIQVIDIPTFTAVDLFHLIAEIDENRIVTGGWVGTCSDTSGKSDPAAITAWQDVITSTLTTLGKRLLAPILSSLPIGIRHIIFFPSAELFLLPLHAVPLSNDGSELVCDRYQVSYAPSLEILASLNTSTLNETRSFYAVINPQSDPQLIFTAMEGAVLAKLFTEYSIDKGLVGTKQRIIEKVQGRTYIHFACHGSYDWNNPASSGLDLADGRLTLTDLQNNIINLSNARLVTLSACETGIIDVMQSSPEEYVGIPAGFLLAGVPCVVSSLWAIPDFSTALLIERLYHNYLSKDMDFAAALREAQIWMRTVSIGTVADTAEQWFRQAQFQEQAELFKLMRHYRYLARQNPDLCPFAHPYYWAAFTVNGM